VLIVLITICNFILNSQINSSREYHGKYNSVLTEQNIKVNDVSHYPMRLFTKMYNYTKGGRVLFCIISTYMILSSITLPCIKCWKSKLEQNKYFQEVSL